MPAAGGGGEAPQVPSGQAWLAQSRWRLQCECGQRESRELLPTTRSRANRGCCSLLRSQRTFSGPGGVPKTDLKPLFDLAMFKSPCVSHAISLKRWFSMDFACPVDHPQAVSFSYCGSKLFYPLGPPGPVLFTLNRLSGPRASVISTLSCP